MKTTSLWICGALLATASTFAAADQPGATTREQRMDSALADYRAGRSGSNASSNTSMNADSQSTDCAQTSNGGALSRAGASIKRGACKTGHALERGVKKTGNAIGTAGRKTGDALRRTGEKMGGSSDKAPSDSAPR